MLSTDTISVPAPPSRLDPVTASAAEVAAFFYADISDEFVAQPYVESSDPADHWWATTTAVSAQPNIDAVLAECEARYADASDPTVVFLNSLVYSGA